MTIELDIEAVVHSIETAFSPLRCVVEVFDYEHRLRFRVFDQKDEAVLTMSEALMRRLQDSGGFKTIISECRAQVEHKGYKLDSWNGPSA